MEGFVTACLLSFGVVFVAELGDKSQLTVLTFATRYRATTVLASIAIAAATVHGASVALGLGLGSALPAAWLSAGAAITFLAFGVWTLRGDSGPKDEPARTRPEASTIVAVTAAFVLAELGDKTMLATVTLAAQHSWFGIWLGSTLGMVAASGLAIVVGRQLSSRLPRGAITYGAGAAFLAFGAWLGADALASLSGVSPWSVATSLAGTREFAWSAVTLYLAVLTVTVKWLRPHRDRFLIVDPSKGRG